MALDRFGAEVFLLLKQRGISLENVLTFGRQHFAIHPREFEEIRGLAGVVADCDELDGTGERFADAFFQALGTSTTDSLDASDYQSCSRIHDLNEPVPESWHAGYDVVFDGGTLEHVFHFPHAVANAMNLVKLGGILITQSPSNNLNGHGFFQFSPELFFRLFDQANGFRILLMAFVESDWPHRVYRIKDPEKIEQRVMFGGHGPLQMIMVAKRCELQKALEAPPYQSDYSASWTKSERSGADTGNASTSRAEDPIKQTLRKLLPADWIRRIERARYQRRRESLSEKGVSEVTSLADCFQTGDRSRENPNPRDMPASNPAN